MLPEIKSLARVSIEISLATYLVAARALTNASVGRQVSNQRLLAWFADKLVAFSEKSQTGFSFDI